MLSRPQRSHSFMRRRRAGQHLRSVWQRRLKLEQGVQSHSWRIRHGPRPDARMGAVHPGRPRTASHARRRSPHRAHSAGACIWSRGPFVQARRPDCVRGTAQHGRADRDRSYRARFLKQRCKSSSYYAMHSIVRRHVMAALRRRRKLALQSRMSRAAHHGAHVPYAMLEALVALARRLQAGQRER